jgi:class 3 adenylate cyclase
MAQTLLAMVVDTDVRDLLPSIRVPTLVLHRAEEFIPVENARYMAERIPGARLVVLPGMDHIPFYGDADGYAEEIEEFLTGARHAPPSDRILTTVMFTDIVGSTERAAALGDARWRELVSRHDELMRAELERHRGREVKTMGDGFLATFDGPARGIRCARAIADEVRSLDIELRAGPHTGECELVGEDIGGMAVNIGARIGALAGADEVIVSSTVKDLVVGSGISFSDRGARERPGGVEAPADAQRDSREGTEHEHGPCPLVTGVAQQRPGARDAAREQTEPCGLQNGLHCDRERGDRKPAQKPRRGAARAIRAQQPCPGHERPEIDRQHEDAFVARRAPNQLRHGRRARESRSE